MGTTTCSAIWVALSVRVLTFRSPNALDTVGPGWVPASGSGSSVIDMVSCLDSVARPSPPSILRKISPPETALPASLR